MYLQNKYRFFTLVVNNFKVFVEQKCLPFHCKHPSEILIEEIVSCLKYILSWYSIKKKKHYSKLYKIGTVINS